MKFILRSFLHIVFWVLVYYFSSLLSYDNDPNNVAKYVGYAIGFFLGLYMPPVQTIQQPTYDFIAGIIGAVISAVFLVENSVDISPLIIIYVCQILLLVIYIVRHKGVEK